MIYRYLDCGDLHNGFARVKCKDCGHEYLLAFSCKRRHFCPSCHQKRVIEFGEWLCTEVLKSVLHRQWVFSIPKRLRIYFMYDRKLLSKLSRCAWSVLSAYLKHIVPDGNATAGAAIAVQTFGEFQNFNPHLHAIVTDGCFSDNGIFHVTPGVKPHDLEGLFHYEVFKKLKAEGKITDAVIENMLSWPPARKRAFAYASESATAVSMCIVDRPFGPMMKTPSRIWPIMSFAQLSLRGELPIITEHESSDGPAKVQRHKAHISDL